MSLRDLYLMSQGLKSVRNNKCGGFQQEMDKESETSQSTEELQ